MKPNEVKVGGKFYTRVSSKSTAQVRVIEDTQQGTKRYVVERCDTGAILRKPRGPGELHTTPGPWVRHGSTEPGGSKPPKDKAPKVTEIRRVGSLVASAPVEAMRKFSALSPEAQKTVENVIDALSVSPKVRHPA